MKVGILSIVMLISLGIMSISYATWIDTLSLANIINVGTWVGCPVISDCYSNDMSGVSTISCGVNANGELQITVTNAQYDESQPVHYNCQYYLRHDGTVPMDIETIPVNGVPVGVSVYPGAVIGDQIDPPGDAAYRTVDICLDSSTAEGSTFTITIGFTFVPWNQ